MYSLKKAKKLANTLINISASAYGINPSNTKVLPLSKHEKALDLPVSFLVSSLLECEDNELTEGVSISDIVDYLNSNWTGFLVTILPPVDSNDKLLGMLKCKPKDKDKPILVLTNIMKLKASTLKDLASKEFPYSDDTATKLKVKEVF